MVQKVKTNTLHSQLCQDVPGTGKGNGISGHLQLRRVHHNHGRGLFEVGTHKHTDEDLDTVIPKLQSRAGSRASSRKTEPADQHAKTITERRPKWPSCGGNEQNGLQAPDW